VKVIQQILFDQGNVIQIETVGIGIHSADTSVGSRGGGRSGSFNGFYHYVFV
jgi:hypothetical protein